MARTVFKIPKTAPAQVATITEKPKRKTAAYARVSSNSDEQETSYVAQVEFYTEYIKNRDDWKFVKVYTDEGITGTSTKHRKGFQQMIQDALDGQIDLIVTKSISRFARNTVDTLTAIRQLKEKNVEVYFEKENIWTLDGKGEVLLTIMSSLAQEESRSISENCRWGQRRRMANGKTNVGFSKFLGYDKGWKINEQQAQWVRMIYRMFLEGYNYSQIARRMTEQGIPTVTGATKWNSVTVKAILTNEKYKR